MAENIIYCYSGSGNCLDIAKNIASKLGDTDIVMMRRDPVIKDASSAKRVGFIFPCYAGGLPGNVERYVRTLKLNPDSYTFGVVSYAGYPGVGLCILDTIVSFDYWAYVPHISSCIWLMPPITTPPMSISKAQERSNKKSSEIAADILAGKVTDKTLKANPLNAMEAKVWPSVPAKMSKKFQVTNACVSCGQCARICPQTNIIMNIGRPRFGERCLQCLSCVQYCKQQAIHLGGATVNRSRYHNPNVSAAELNSPVIHID